MSIAMMARLMASEARCRSPTLGSSGSTSSRGKTVTSVKRFSANVSSGAFLHGQGAIHPLDGGPMCYVYVIPGIVATCRLRRKVLNQKPGFLVSRRPCESARNRRVVSVGGRDDRGGT